MTIYGTRPEAIKMAPLIRALDDSPLFEPVVAVTGQHRTMLDQVNSLFGIVPQHDLELMVPGATLTQISARVLAAVSRLLDLAAPDAVVVQGDTSTAFFSALAAFYHRVPVIHLEAGLRTGDIASPFPEEMHRLLTAPLAALHLAPTASSRLNLRREHVPAALIATTGNTVIDALRTAADVPVRYSDHSVQQLVEGNAKYVLVTAHRRESWGGPMREAMVGIRRAVRRFPRHRFLIPMHPNPLVREVIVDVLGDSPEVLLTEPLSYHQFVHAMRGAEFVITDSGGIQEEAPSFGKPVLVMRDTTERPEAVEYGTVKLIGTAQEDVLHSISQLIEDADVFDRMANAVNPYGDGHAAARSIAAMEHLLGLGEKLPDFAPAPSEYSSV
jgi:UDP-N-acetylglucosamine 2-epimerase (non-hydrolysing)